MDEVKICLWCEKEFVPGHWLQKYCDCECSRQAERESKRTLKKKKKKKEDVCKQPDVTIEDMVAECVRLSKERGRIVNYGDLQQMMLTGQHTFGG